MNAPGTTWPSAPVMSTSFGSSGNMWQQPSTTNPFAAPNGASVCSSSRFHLLMIYYFSTWVLMV